MSFGVVIWNDDLISSNQIPMQVIFYNQTTSISYNSSQSPSSNSFYGLAAISTSGRDRIGIAYDRSYGQLQWNDNYSTAYLRHQMISFLFQGCGASAPYL